MKWIRQKFLNLKDSSKKALDNFLTPRSRKFIKYSIIIILILAFIPEIYIAPYYFVVVKPAGEGEINQILEKVQSLNTTEERVSAISNWEEQNFTNIYGISPNISLDFGWYPFLGSGRYPVYLNFSNQQPLKIRAFISPFTNDPYWISYFHSGACGELSELFHFVTNKSQIESRIVSTKGEDHAWVEIKVNDTWMYFDPTLVEIYNRNPENRNKWFSEPKNFEDAWGWNLSRVTVLSTSEDISTAYTKVGNVSVHLVSSKEIKISKYDVWKKDWFLVLSRNGLSSESPIEENIQLGEFNLYRIRATNYGGGINPIPKYQEKEFFLNSTENMSIYLDPNNGEFDHLSGIIIIAGCIIVFVYEIVCIRNWLQKRRELKK
jgi:hypothetical protein